MLNRVDSLIRYVRSIVTGNDLTEKTSTQGTGTIPLSQNLSYIKSVVKGSTCLFEGWDYTLELDKTTRGFYKITFPTSDVDYVITYYTGESKVYPDFPDIKAQMPRISVIQGMTSYNSFGNGAWNSTSSYQNFRTVPFNIYVLAHKDDYYTLNGVTYYGLSAIDAITEELLINLTSIGSPVGSGGITTCDRKKDRPFIYPFLDFNIRSVGQVEYDSQYGIWSRNISVEGKYV